MLASVIVPFYNRWDLTHACLFGLYQHAPENIEIILVNDASSDSDCRSGAAWWQKRAARHKIRYLENKTNLGFGGSMNRGAKVAHGDVLIFLSNDVIIYGDFISEILEKIRGTQNSLVGGRLVYWPAGWNEFEDADGKIIVPYAEGWLLACKKEIWHNLGGFDRRYGKFDYEDVDLSTAALLGGVELIGLNSQNVRHLGGQTAGYDDCRMRITQRNRLIYIEKWRNELHLLKNLETGHDRSKAIAKK